MRALTNLPGLLAFLFLVACTYEIQPYDTTPATPVGSYVPTPTTPVETHTPSPTPPVVPSATPSLPLAAKAIKAKLGEPVRLRGGQVAVFEGTELSVHVLDVRVPPADCFDCPRTATVMVKSNAAMEQVSFQVGLMSQEAQQRARNKMALGFVVSLLQIKESDILLRVERAQ